MNKTISQICEEYKAEARWMLRYCQKHFERLPPESMESFARRMEELGALIHLYSELEAARRS